MRINHVLVKNFRGIKYLDWILHSPTICLIGPNDSTKSTILDAIELTLTPRRNPTFADTDFYELDTKEAIEILVTLGDLPIKVLQSERFLFNLRGWKDGHIEDEPDDDTEIVCTIRLRVDHSLEPEWSIFTDRNSSNLPRATNLDRALFAMIRIGTYLDWDLSWANGSLISRFTGKDQEGLASILAELNREARKTLTTQDMKQLLDAASELEKSARLIGVRPKNAFVPAFDPEATSLATGGITLHDGNIPARMLGLGSRRLLALTMQRSLSDSGTLLLLDELEHGLEPYRVRQLVRMIRADTPPKGKEPHLRQSIVTTHSPVAICEFKANELAVVRSSSGKVTIYPISSEVQNFIRKVDVPESLLSKRVIVGEGKTEVGLLRAMNKHWASIDDGKDLSYFGVTMLCGGGTESPQTAKKLASWGYDVLLLVDNDLVSQKKEQFDAYLTEVQSLGVQVVMWDPGNKIETQIFADLPIERFSEALEIVVEAKGKQSVLDKLRDGFNANGQYSIDDLSIENWLQHGIPEKTVREVVGAVANSQEWFKIIDRGERIGEIIVRSLDELTGTTLAARLNEILSWTRRE